jgi:signal recognition particle receptor subunit beta
MVLINYAGREINAKIVYYGPGLSGKTTNLECIYASVPGNSRGKMVSMKTRQDRTLFFDFLPLELGEIHGFRTRFLLYTVPGQVFYNATRKLVLKGADAVVFVADSTQGKMEDNVQSLQNLEENLRENNLSLENIPWVIQYNKRDLSEIHSVEELESALNPGGVPHFEAAAATGRGVYETLHAVSRLLFQRLRSEFGRHAGTARTSRASATRAGGGPARPTSGVQQAPATQPTSGVTQAPMTQPTSGVMQAPASSPASTSVQAPTSGITTEALGVARPTSTSGLQRPSQVLERPEVPAEPEASESHGGSQEYGHTIELSEEVQAADEPPMEGFIRDPMRRPEGSTDPKASPGSLVRVPVVVKASDLKPGATLQIVLEIRVES